MLWDIIVKDVVDVITLTAQASICGIISVVGYLIENRVPLPEGCEWIFSVGIILNIFGATASTIGKFYIVLHRYVVMKNGSVVEEVWSQRTSRFLIAIMLIFSLCRIIPLFFYGFAYSVVDGVKIITFFDDSSVVVDKILSSATYFIYSIVTIILTILSSRELYKLSKNSEAKTKQVILRQQRNMFIIVASCTLSHIIKALHQMSWIFVRAFRLQSWNIIIRDMYAYPHYLATYVTSITLVVFSAKVRKLIFSKSEEPAKKSTTSLNNRNL